MAQFEYEAMSVDGHAKSGTLSAETSAEVVASLARQNLTAVSVKELPKDADSAPQERQEHVGDLTRSRIKSEDLMIFTRQLATMVDAGLPIDHAIETLAEQARTENFKNVLYAILRDIRRGTRISGALAPYKRIFPDIYVTMVRAAEASGELARILNQLAGYMESAQRVRQKVKAAMTYPVLATCMIMVVASVLLLVVVPKFAQMFTLIKGELPLPTKIVLALSNFARGNAIVMVLLIAAVIAAFVITLKTTRGRYYFDLFKLRVPIFGELFSKVAVARFSRTLSTLLSSGVPILDALNIVERASGNAIIAEAVRESVNSVSGGSGLAEVFATKPVFPPMLVKMIAVGEQTGQLDKLLNKIADFYDERVTAAVEGLTSMIEPLLIGFLGVVVGGIVVAIFFPMVKLTQSIGGG